MAKLGSFDWAAKKKAFVFFGEHSKYVPRNVGMTQGRDPGEAPSHVINPVPPSALGPTVEVVHGHLLTSIRHAKPGQIPNFSAPQHHRKKAMKNNPLG